MEKEKINKKKNLMKIQIGNNTLWVDVEQWKAQEEFSKEQERQYWNYVFSGQRTLDMFGEEGAKRVLEEQRLRDETHN